MATNHHWRTFARDWPKTEDPAKDRDHEEWNLADGIGLYTMAKILSYSFLVISNRLRRSEEVCKQYYESGGEFQTIPQDQRATLADNRKSTVSGEEISSKLQTFFARPGSSEKILASLKPWGYAGIQGLAGMIIEETCSDDPVVVPSGPASQRNRRSPGARDDIQDKNPGPPVDGLIQDVRPWLTPGAKWFPLIPCKYFSVGRCHKADDCTFLHQAPSNYKPSSRNDAERRRDDRDRERPSRAVVDRSLRAGSSERSRRDDPYSGSSRDGDRKRSHDDGLRYSDRPIDTSFKSSRSVPSGRRDDRDAYRGDVGRPSESSRDIRGDRDPVPYRRSPPRRTSPPRYGASERYASNGSIGSIDRHDYSRSYSDRPARFDDRRPPRDDSDLRRSDRSDRDRHEASRSVPRQYSSNPGYDRASEQDLKRQRRDDRARSPLPPPLIPKPIITISAADSIKNAENLLETAQNGPNDAARTNAIGMLDRYLTLQSKSPKLENNIQIYDYLLGITERAPKDHRPRYFKFLHSYIELIHKDMPDFSHMNVMMGLAERSSGEAQARAVPLLDRYMAIASTLA